MFSKYDLKVAIDGVKLSKTPFQSFGRISEKARSHLDIIVTRNLLKQLIRRPKCSRRRVKEEEITNILGAHGLLVPYKHK